MPRASVSPASKADYVTRCTHDPCKTPCDTKNMIIDELISQTDSYIKSEVHREFQMYFNLPPNELAKVKQSQLKKLLFYRLVQGGNIDIVSSVLDDIRQIDNTLYNYLISGKHMNCECDKLNTTASGSFVFLSMTIYCFVMIPFFILTTPIFYTMHSLVVGMYTNRKISKTSRFPLLFAAMSNNQHMMQLFAKHRQGILCDTDEEGNNIFHYLAEVSMKKPERAMQCFKLIANTFACSLIRKVLQEEKNFNGFTALEQSVLKGSPQYFTLLLETHGIMKSAALAISERYINSNKTTAASGDTKSVGLQKSDNFTYVSGETTSSDSSYTIFHYDITKYEQGDVLGDNSFLLTLLTRRDLTAMSESEVESIVSSSLLTQWMRIKIKSMKTIRNLQFVVSNLLVQIFTIYVTTIGEADNSERFVISFWNTVNQLAIDNATKVYNPHQTVSKSTAITFNNSFFIAPAVDKLTTACGFDVSNYLPSGNITSIDLIKSSGLSIWLISVFITLLPFISILFDLYLRLVFLTKNFYYSGWKKGPLKHRLMIRRVMARPMQVSYVERQLILASSTFCSLMMYFFSRSRNISAVDVDSANEKSVLRTIAMMLTVACMSARFFALLYTLRAQENMNIAGRFVLTMCKMFSFIIEFSWIYFIISAFFAGIFMLVVYDPVCAYKNFYPFDTWPSSMIGVFKLMLGDNVLPDRLTSEAAFTYVIYINLTTVVVLSLVTGISGGIADKVLSRRLIGILQNVESLEGAIESESSSHVGPLRLFRYFHIRRLKNEHKIISDIDKESNILKVAIEVESLSSEVL